MFRALRDFAADVIDGLVSDLQPLATGRPSVPEIKAERQAAAQAFHAAKARGDTRAEHTASNDLIRLTSAQLRAEVGR